MSARDELAAVIDGTDLLGCGCCGASTEIKTGPDEFDVDYPARSEALAHAILAAGYSKPRTIRSAAELESLPLGSAVRTSDDSDTVVLRGEGEMFRNQSGGEVDWTTLWRFGTHPFTLLYTPKES